MIKTLIRTLKRRWAKDTRGVVALEMAIVSPLLIIAIIFLMEMGIDFYFQEVLDYATETAARQIQTGHAQNAGTSTTSAQFVTNVMCPLVNGLLSCGSIMVNVSVVPDFYTGSTYTLPTTSGKLNKNGFSYCNVGPAELVQVNAVYMAPALLLSFFTNTVSFGGSPSIAIKSTAAFMTEQYPSTGITANGC
jgi:Flp pilus assembly protein TadG